MTVNLLSHGWHHRAASLYEVNIQKLELEGIDVVFVPIICFSLSVLVYLITKWNSDRPNTVIIYYLSYPLVQAGDRVLTIRFVNSSSPANHLSEST